MRYDTISFLSDYGHADESVGVCKSVIRSIAPDADVIDVTHGLPSFDVRAASLALVRAAHFLVPGVVLAAVDPAAGSDRRLIAVEVGGGESVLVGPDNGVFAPVVAMLGGPGRVVQIESSRLFTASVDSLFAGRDVLAPIAAHLCIGVDLEEVGPSVDSATLTPALLPFSSMENGVVTADVLWIDQFGNAQMNIEITQLHELGSTVSVKMPTGNAVLRLVSSFANVKLGESGLTVDANGMVSLFVNQGSAALHHRLSVGDAITLSKAIPLR